MVTMVNPGELFDHYRIKGIAAEGSTSLVYRGTDVRTNRDVAIKIPRPEIENDPILFARFRREQELGENLAHPGLLKVVADEGRTKNYVVTEWFEGKSLRELLTEHGKLPQERAIRITLGLCDVLNYIHGHGVVHRDLKPENILVDSSDHIKLINFGAAGQAQARRITFTNLSQVVGMSEYISPEETNGKRGDARSDIYALGVILYEMLTGKAPYQGIGHFDRMIKDPVPPRDLDPSISPQLQEVIYRALEREPKNRYASAHEMALDLTHLDRVGVAVRQEIQSGKRGTSQRRVGFFVVLGLIPIVIFVLLLYFARH
jgi:eukaryotic-like serine/threonine-protein kinase